MTSPNEPGHPGPGDSPNGSGSGDRGGAQHPPPARSSAAPRRAPADAPKPREPRAAARPAAAPNADARLNRFISGTAAPGAAKTPPRDVDAPADPARSETRRDEAYASELPDLSGPTPRAGQRKPAAEPGADTSTTPVRTERRIQVAGRAQGPVRASMQIRRIDPWSTLKVSLVLSVALFFVWMIAVAFLYLVLGGMGVWSKLNSNVGDLLNNTSGSSADLVSSGTIFGGAVLIGLVNIVLLSAMATIGAFIYNLTTDLIGGVEVTLADRD
ncbi:DUF3566 domain-containing protein [Mycobacterium sp.]|uniref:DUF3566 domain-containing protein n=1 Tax=Mycobacterium sp. TaxID=1785 RepID=UPI003C7726B8